MGRAYAGMEYQLNLMPDTQEEFARVPCLGTVRTLRSFTASPLSNVLAIPASNPRRAMQISEEVHCEVPTVRVLAQLF